jgi:hypothetical protein
MTSQIENCNLCEETKDLQRQVDELQKALDAVELESVKSHESSAPCQKKTVDAL